MARRSSTTTSTEPAPNQLQRVAVVSDVVGNAVAMAAVARELVAARPDAVVFGGDLTFGPMPEGTWSEVTRLRHRLAKPVFFIRGNADRALTGLRVDARARQPTPRERWILAQHTDAMLDALASFRPTLILDVDGLGPTRFCHGSPRSDEELITPSTPDARMEALLAGVDEHVLVSAHSHIQFDRRVAGARSINPGSAGMPYQRPTGAYWALLGPDVELCRTDYDVDVAVAAYRETEDPLVEAVIETLLAPPTGRAVVNAAESLRYSR